MSGYVSPFHDDELSSYEVDRANARIRAEETARREFLTAFAAAPEPVCSEILASATPETRKLLAAVLACAKNPTGRIHDEVGHHLSVARHIIRDPRVAEEYSARYLLAAEPDRAAILAHAAKLSPATRARYLASKRGLGGGIGGPLRNTNSSPSPCNVK